MSSSREYLFTSESVTEGHPDKMADQVSDAILDAMLAEDPESRVAVETLFNTGICVVAGEVTTNSYVDVQQVVRDTVLGIGYDNAKYGFDGRTCGVLLSIDQQSPDIAQGVDTAIEERVEHTGDELDHLGAGDQGMMFGYATDETDEYMPLPAVLAHGIARRLAEVRRTGEVPYLRPDGKAQVTVRYVDDVPVEVVAVVLSTQHARVHDGETLAGSERLQRDIVEHVIKPVLGERWSDSIRTWVNPTGAFVLGGPQADAGLTGRKVIVDTYGGMARHGGGAFSGKDPTKVDRSAAYATRWVARSVVAAGLAKRCEVQVAYAIGVAHPVSMLVDTFGTGTVDDDVLRAAIDEVFDLRPAAIIRDLDLRRPIYNQVAAYGHFGRTDLDLPWEGEDRVEALRGAVERIAGGDVAATTARA